MKEEIRVPKTLVLNSTEHGSQVTPSLSQLQAELSERKLYEEELYRLNNDLEHRLRVKTAELIAVKAELSQETQRRLERDNEISLLNNNLSRQAGALNTVTKELESFNYSVSHDLRAPLRHMVGFSSALVEDFSDSLDATAQSYLDCIVRAGRKMESLIEALLNLSRITRQELSFADVDLSQMARECAESLKKSAPEREVVFNIADKLSVQADAVLLKAAIANLLGNAWKYTGKKKQATIELGWKQEGDVTVYYVRDNGAGFDLQYADKLFGPFQKMHSDAEYEGAGVGLATVQRIIHRHGGKIWAEAEVDSGATFYFTLS